MPSPGTETPVEARRYPRPRRGGAVGEGSVTVDMELARQLVERELAVGDTSQECRPLTLVEGEDRPLAVLLRVTHTDDAVNVGDLDASAAVAGNALAPLGSAEVGSLHLLPPGAGKGPR